MNLSRAYIAGLFDGEGCIGIYRHHRGRFSLRTQLTQNKYRESTKVLRALTLRYGGSLSPQIGASGRKKFNWQLHSEAAARFLLAILPYLMLKKRQAEVAIRWQEGRPMPHRTASGHFARYPDDRKDYLTSCRLKALKKS